MRSMRMFSTKRFPAGDPSKLCPLFLDKFRSQGALTSSDSPYGDHQYGFLARLLLVNPKTGFAGKQLDDDIASKFKTTVDRQDRGIPYTSPLKLPGFYSHRLSKGGLVGILQEGVLRSGDSLYGVGVVFAHDLSSPLDFKRLPDFMKPSSNQDLIFTTQSSKPHKGKLHPGNDEYTWPHNLDIKPVLVNDKGVITIHDFNMAAFLMAQYAEKFQAARGFMNLVGQAYEIALDPTKGLIANGEKFFDELPNKERRESMKKIFNSSVKEALAAHDEMQKFVEDNPALKKVMEDMGVYKEFVEIPAEVVEGTPDLSVKPDIK